MIWLLFGSMLLAAALVVAWPLYRTEKRLSPGLAAAVVVVLGVTAALYTRIGTPVPPPPVASVDEMVAELDRRLQENPQDLEGWKMLGRSYRQLSNYAQAAAAFERALALETPPTAQTLASLGETLLLHEGTDRSTRPNELFESALAVEPGNAKALFYGGILAIERGDRDLAASRWEQLLAQSPPPEIEEVLRQRIAEWRGEAAPTDQAGAAAAPVTDSILSVKVSLGPDAAASVGEGATVYIIARDPAQPSPPIAATRRIVSELPAQVFLSDADAMLPGRLLSAFDRLEIVARVSMSGEPVAQPGDWYGQRSASMPDAEPLEIVIDHQVE